MVKIGISDKYWRKYVNVDANPDWVEQENRRLKKQAECDHEKWIKRCSVCNAILESDATVSTDHPIHEHIL